MTDETRRLRLALCLLPLGAFTLASTVGVAFMPYLLSTRPLLLVALSPLFRHLVLAAPSLTPGALFAVAVPRHFVVDPFCYYLGREYGPVAIAWVEENSPGMGRLVRGLSRLVNRVGALALLVYPDIVVSTLVGAARVPFPLFVVANVLGTIGTVAVARWFGTALEAQIGLFVAYLRAHVVGTTIASILLVALFNAWSQRRRRTAEPTIETPGEG